MRGERVEHFETVRRCKDGRLINVSTTISPIRDHCGNVIGASKIARDITRTKEAEAEIHRLAYYDPLTGLPNRRLLHDRLNHAIQTSARHGHGSAILFIDLDNFKTLNDTRGHDVGDVLLQQVAQRLSACVRECDTVARFGGDEFVVILECQNPDPAVAANHAEMVGDKILDRLSQPYALNGDTHHCTPSIGVTLFNGQPCTTDGPVLPAKAGDLLRGPASYCESCVERPSGQAMVQRRSVRVDHAQGCARFAVASR